MRTDPYKDPIEIHRKKIEKIKMDETNIEENEEVHRLPTRSELHGSRTKKRKKKKRKMTFPLLRVLLTFFILLPIISFSLYTFILKKSFFLDLGAKMAGEEVPYEFVSPGKKQAKQPSTYNNSGSNENKNSGEQETQNDSVAEKIDMETNSQTNKEDQKIIFHTVQPNETLYSIALKYYHSKSGIDRIKQWNDLSNDGIIVGQVLEIHLP
ncbi:MULTISPECIES: LysM peptidoglycan-binding domain-containing protein [Heyndrickxia]|uniref:LysM peptidoglycan-binding domain-containing protein n=1 Tax=Heyndrickxia TaxID=2837504 RepID=UPI001B129639|nr:LysM domain-containing protein [Heyndrickxia oleronia]GIN38218.1 hypothetical protein J19TS1_11670 [Heyndrickxia oleronia]